MRNHRPSHTFATTPPRRPSSAPLGRRSDPSRGIASTGRYDPIAVDPVVDNPNVPLHLKKWAATPASTPTITDPAAPATHASATHSGSGAAAAANKATIPGLVSSADVASRMSSDHGVTARPTSLADKTQPVHDSSYSSFALLAAAAAASSSSATPSSPVAARRRSASTAGTAAEAHRLLRQGKIGRHQRKHQHLLRQRRKIIGLRQQEEPEDEEQDEEEDDYEELPYEEDTEDHLEEGEVGQEEEEEEEEEEEDDDDDQVREEDLEEGEEESKHLLRRGQQKQRHLNPPSHSPQLSSHQPQGSPNQATARRHHSLHYSPTPRALTRLRSLRDRDRQRSRSSHSHSDNHLPSSMRPESLLNRARRVFSLPTSAKHRRSAYTHHYQRQHTLHHLPQRPILHDQQQQQQHSSNEREQHLHSARGQRLYTLNDADTFDTDHSTILQPSNSQLARQPSSSHSRSPPRSPPQSQSHSPSPSPSPLIEKTLASPSAATAAASPKRRSPGVFGGRASPTFSYNGDDDGGIRLSGAASLLGRAGRRVSRPFSPRNQPTSQANTVSNSTFAPAPATSTAPTNRNSGTKATPTTDTTAAGVNLLGVNPTTTSATNIANSTRRPTNNPTNAPSVIAQAATTPNDGNDALHMRIRVLENELEASRIRQARQRRRIQQLEEESAISRQALPALEAIIKSALTHFDAKEAALKHTIANMHREMGAVVAEKNEAMRLLASFVGRTTRSPPASFSSSLSEAALDGPPTRERRPTPTSPAVAAASQANPVAIAAHRERLRERERDFVVPELGPEDRLNQSVHQGGVPNLSAQ